MPLVLITVQSASKKLPAVSAVHQRITWCDLDTNTYQDFRRCVHRGDITVKLLSFTTSEGSFRRLTVVQTSIYHFRRPALVFTTTKKSVTRTKHCYLEVETTFRATSHSLEIWKWMERKLYNYLEKYC